MAQRVGEGELPADVGTWPPLRESLNELKTGNSMWPELCCAISQPWFLLVRTAARLRFLAQDSTMIVAVAVWLGVFILSSSFQTIAGLHERLASAYNGPARDRETRLAGAYDALAVLMQVLLSLAIFLFAIGLRRRVRLLYNIPGGALTDVCMSIWPCSFLSIAAMDHLTRDTLGAAAPVAPAAPSSPAPPTGPKRWQTGLFACTVDNLPALFCALGCPWFMQTRMCVRLSYGQEGVNHSALKCLCLFGLFFLNDLLWSLCASMSLANPVAAGVLGFFAVIALLASLGVTVLIRGRTRARLGIEGSLEQDACASLCCAPCVLTQMNSEEGGNTAAAVGGGGQALPQQQPLPQQQQIYGTSVGMMVPPQMMQMQQQPQYAPQGVMMVQPVPQQPWPTGQAVWVPLQSPMGPALSQQEMVQAVQTTVSTAQATYVQY